MFSIGLMQIVLKQKNQIKMLIEIDLLIVTKYHVKMISLFCVFYPILRKNFIIFFRSLFSFTLSKFPVSRGELL